MPFLTPEPWEVHKYEKWARLAELTTIPLYDEAVWENFINLRPYSNKLYVSQLLHYDCGPMGVFPKKYPVYCKPIYNLYGSGGGFAVYDEKEYMSKYKPGYYFMPLFEGEHRSVDVLIHDNVVFWSATAIGHTLPENRFWCWELTETKTEHHDIINKIITWSIQIIPSYSGAMNFEFIGNGVIEIHFRFASQWCEFYGEDWFYALINLYKYNHKHTIKKSVHLWSVFFLCCAYLLIAYCTLTLFCFCVPFR